MINGLYSSPTSPSSPDLLFKTFQCTVHCLQVALLATIYKTYNLL